MIAYDPSGLDNRYFRETAAKADEEQLISAEEHAKIRSIYPEHFYSPPFFARLGLFVLTCICLCFGSGFFAFLTVIAGQEHYFVQIFLMAIIVFFVLEWLIRNKKHLASGVDDALLYTGVSLLIGGCYLVDEHMSPMAQSLLFLIVASGCVIRYADRLMALIAFAALLAFVFFTGLKAGSLGKALMPFILMAVCAGTYFFLNAGGRKKSWRHYYGVFDLLKVASLVCLYAAGNYFVVREANGAMSGRDSGASAEIPLAWLFWGFTLGIPALYIYLGLKRKARQFLATGLILIAAAAFTVRYYHSVLAPEWALVAGGAVLLATALLCLRYLRKPRAGFTAERTGKDPFARLAQVEALLIDETLSPATVHAPQVVFGGGSGGGGGAGGQF